MGSPSLTLFLLLLLRLDPLQGKIHLMAGFVITFTYFRIALTYIYISSNLIDNFFAILAFDGVMGILRVVISSVILCPKLMKPLNLMLCLTKLYALSCLATFPVEFSNKEHMLMLFIFELAVVFCTVMLPRQLISAWKAEIRENLRNAATHRSQCSVETILDHMCDAVVKLQANFRISSPAPKLASLLLKDSTGNALQGMLLTDLMHDEDCQHFLQHITALTGCEENQSSSSFTHARFWDSTCTIVHMKLFFSSFVDEQGERSYRIGICEVTNGESYQRELKSKFPAMVTTEDACQNAAVDTMLASSPCRSDTVSPLPNSHHEAKHFEVTVDALSSELEIIDCSQRFAALCVTKPIGNGMLGWIPNRREAGVFFQWMQERVNAVVNGRENFEAAGKECKFGKLTIMPPCSRAQLGMQYRGRCSLVIVEQQCGGDDDEEDFQVRATLCFEDMKKQAVKEPKAQHSDIGNTVKGTTVFLPAKVSVATSFTETGGTPRVCSSVTLTSR
jgi:hypothetical protein